MAISAKLYCMAAAAAGLMVLAAGCGAGAPAGHTAPPAQSTPAPRDSLGAAGSSTPSTTPPAASRQGGAIPALILTGTVLNGDHPAAAGTTITVATLGQGTRVTVCGTGSVGNAANGAYEVDLPAQLPQPCTGANTQLAFFVHGVYAGGITWSIPDPGRVVDFNIAVPDLPPADGGSGDGAPAAVVLYGSATITDASGVHAAPDGTVIQVRAGQNGNGPVCGQGTTTSATYQPDLEERGRYRIDIAATPGCYGQNLQYALFVGQQRVATFTASAPPLGQAVDVNLNWRATAGQGQDSRRSQ